MNVKSRYSFWESVLSFHHAGSEDQTQVTTFSGKHLYSVSHHASLSFMFSVETETR